MEGFAFYESRQPGLGDYFFDSIATDIDSLMSHAGIHRKVLGFHRLLARTFPFAIYYDIVGDDARVCAILIAGAIRRTTTLVIRRKRSRARSTC